MASIATAENFAGMLLRNGGHNNYFLWHLLFDEWEDSAGEWKDSTRENSAISSTSAGESETDASHDNPDTHPPGTKRALAEETGTTTANAFAETQAPTEKDTLPVIFITLPPGVDMDDVQAISNLIDAAASSTISSPKNPILVATPSPSTTPSTPPTISTTAPSKGLTPTSLPTPSPSPCIRCSVDLPAVPQMTQLGFLLTFLCLGVFAMILVFCGFCWRRTGPTETAKDGKSQHHHTSIMDKNHRGGGDDSSTKKDTPGGGAVDKMIIGFEEEDTSTIKEESMGALYPTGTFSTVETDLEDIPI